MTSLNEVLRGLDWKTPVRRVNSRYHWRVTVALLLCAVLAVAVWHFLFPNTDWFLKFWNGSVTGAFLGLLVGYTWQLSDQTRRAGSSGGSLAWTGIGLFFFSLFAVFVGGPDLYFQELELAKIRGLSPSNVVAIRIKMPNRLPKRIADDASIVAFLNQCRESTLFYPNHEVSTVECDLTIELADGTVLQYPAGIPERHQTDMSVRFRAYFTFADILIPGGATWIDDQGQSQVEEGRLSETRDDGKETNAARGTAIEYVLILLLFCLIPVAAVWLVLCGYLFHRLRTRHPEIYQQLGSPSLFHAPEATLSLLRFLFGRQFRQLGDPALTRLRQFMRLLLLAYTWTFANSG